MKQLKKVIFANGSPCLRSGNDSELKMAVYFFVITVTAILTISIIEL